MSTTNLLNQDHRTAVSTQEANCSCVECKIIEKAVELFNTEDLEECLAANQDLTTHDYATGCLITALLSDEIGEFGNYQLGPKQAREMGFEVLGKAFAF